MQKKEVPVKAAKNTNRGAYVKSPHYNEEQHGCQICLEPVCHPRRCKVCKLMCCRDCMSRCKKTNNRCPKKCTEGEWIADEVPPMNIEFDCPYSKECKDIILAEDFNDHFFKCKQIPEEAKNELKEENLKKHHRCSNGHDLQFLGQGSVHLVTQFKCAGAECSGGRFCRSQCEQCSEAYCCFCRLPAKLTNRKCPRQHMFKIRRNTSFVSCDVCCKSVSSSGAAYCYNDQACDFAVCVNCMPRLPVDAITTEYQDEATAAVRRGMVLD